MQLIIKYKGDRSAVPFGANTEVNGEYLCAWSETSFEDAKRQLLKKVQDFLHPVQVPPIENIQVEEEVPHDPDDEHWIDYVTDPEPICYACRKDRHEYCIRKKGLECWCETSYH